MNFICVWLDHGVWTSSSFQGLWLEEDGEETPTMEDQGHAGYSSEDVDICFWLGLANMCQEQHWKSSQDFSGNLQ